MAVLPGLKVVRDFSREFCYSGWQILVDWRLICALRAEWNSMVACLDRFLSIEDSGCYIARLSALILNVKHKALGHSPFSSGHMTLLHQ